MGGCGRMARRPGGGVAGQGVGLVNGGDWVGDDNGLGKERIGG